MKLRQDFGRKMIHNDMTLLEVGILLRDNGWKWEPGTQARVQVVNYGKIAKDRRPYRLGADSLDTPVMRNYDPIPDLEDRATLGCLLGQVRDLHGPYVSTMHRPQGWNVVRYSKIEYIGDGDQDTWGFIPLLAGEWKTEGHALVQAFLTKKP